MRAQRFLLSAFVLNVFIVSVAADLHPGKGVADSFVPPHLAHGQQTLRQARNFNVKYVGNPPSEVANAVQYAGMLWETLLEMNSVINIEFTWQSIDDQYLGLTRSRLCQISMNQAVSSALVKQLSSTDCPSAGTDIISIFNSKVNWYFGLDGNPPAGKTDLVTVLVHEIGHGLGFSGSLRKCDAGNSVAYDESNSLKGDSYLYDSFLRYKDSGGVVMEDRVGACSSSWFQKLTSSGVLFDLPPDENGTETTVTMYAPPTFAAALYHLDEEVYPPGTCNSLMTPFLDRGEVIHYPGQLSLRILAALGWKLQPGALTADCLDFGTNGTLSSDSSPAAVASLPLVMLSLSLPIAVMAAL